MPPVRQTLLVLASRGERNPRDQPRKREPRRAHPLQRAQVATAARIERRPALRAPRSERAHVLATVGTAIRICHELIQAEPQVEGTEQRVRIAKRSGGGSRPARLPPAAARHRAPPSKVRSTFDGNAPGKIRTCDLCLRRAALYPLSYGRLAVKSTVAADPDFARFCSTNAARERFPGAFRSPWSPPSGGRIGMRRGHALYPLSYGRAGSESSGRAFAVPTSSSASSGTSTRT